MLKIWGRRNMQKVMQLVGELAIPHELTLMRKSKNPIG
jgi:hypothetical protein